MRIDLSCDEERNFVGFKRSRFVYTEKRGIRPRRHLSGAVEGTREGHRRGEQPLQSFVLMSIRKGIFARCARRAASLEPRSRFTFRGKVCRRA